METFVAKDTYSIHFQLMAGHTVRQAAYLIYQLIVGCSLVSQESAWSIKDCTLRCIHPPLLHRLFMLRECTNNKNTWHSFTLRVLDHICFDARAFILMVTKIMLKTTKVSIIDIFFDIDNQHSHHGYTSETR
jgi:hypothetical protein